MFQHFWNEMVLKQDFEERHAALEIMTYARLNTSHFCGGGGGVLVLENLDA